MRMWAQGIGTCFHYRDWVCSVRTKHEKLKNEIIINKIFTGCAADGSGGPECCTSSDQCGEGEGDCDSDVDCAGNLKCGQLVHYGQGNGLDGNCDTSLGFHSDYDCCYDPGSDG